jgi:hypothetical protein
MTDKIASPELRKEVDAEKVRWCVARMQKAAGKVDMNVFMASLTVMAGQIIAQTPRDRHQTHIQQFSEAVAGAVLLTYPKDELDKMRAEAYENMEREREKAVEAVGAQMEAIMKDTRETSEQSG